MKPITVYSKPNCPHCDRVKNQLRKLGYDFHEVNVQQDDEQRNKLVEDWGYRLVPVVEFDGDTIMNPSPADLEQFLDLEDPFDEF